MARDAAGRVRGAQEGRDELTVRGPALSALELPRREASSKGGVIVHQFPGPPLRKAASASLNRQENSFVLKSVSGEYLKRQDAELLNRS